MKLKLFHWIWHVLPGKQLSKFEMASLDKLPAKMFYKKHSKLIHEAIEARGNEDDTDGELEESLVVEAAKPTKQGTAKNVKTTATAQKRGQKSEDENATTIKLIELVREYPILYNKQLEGHKNKDRRMQLWVAIAKELQMMSGSQAAERWQNIRRNRATWEKK